MFDVATDTTLGSTAAATNGALVFTTTNFNIGSGAKTLTVNSPVTISGVITSGATANNFTKAGPSTLELSGANTYDRPTAVTAGTLLVKGGGRLGSSANAQSVTVGENGLLDLRSATGGLSPNAILRVTSTDAAPEVNLTVDDAVAQFVLNTVSLGPGVYGSTASGAANPGLLNPDDVFSGTGRLTVALPEPAAAALLLPLAAAAATARRRRPA